MTTQKNLVDFSSLSEMLYGDNKYIKEFAEAAIISFSEFSERYSLFLLQRDEVNFRKAGHKIKPVAQMLGIDQILEEYEYGKTLIWDEKPEKQLKASSTKMTKVCDKVLAELKDIISQH